MNVNASEGTAGVLIVTGQDAADWCGRLGYKALSRRRDEPLTSALDRARETGAATPTPVLALDTLAAVLSLPDFGEVIRAGTLTVVLAHLSVESLPPSAIDRVTWFEPGLPSSPSVVGVSLRCFAQCDRVPLGTLPQAIVHIGIGDEVRLPPPAIAHVVDARGRALDDPDVAAGLQRARLNREGVLLRLDLPVDTEGLVAAVANHLPDHDITILMPSAPGDEPPAVPESVGLVVLVRQYEFVPPTLAVVVGERGLVAMLLDEFGDPVRWRLDASSPLEALTTLLAEEGHDLYGVEIVTLAEQRDTVTALLGAGAPEVRMIGAESDVRTAARDLALVGHDPDLALALALARYWRALRTSPSS